MNCFRFNMLASTVLALAIGMLSMCSTSGQEEKPADKNGAHKKPPEEELGAKITRLIDQLADGDKQASEAASKSLLKIDPEAVVPPLRRLLMHRDANIRQRAKDVFDPLKKKLDDNRQLERVNNEKRLRERFAKETSFGIDYYVGRIMRDLNKLTDDDWEILNQIEEKIKIEGRAGIVQKDSLPQLYYKNFQRINTPAFDNKGGILSLTCVAADSIKAGVIGNSMLLCRKSIDIDHHAVNRSVGLFGNECRLKIGVSHSSVLVSEGDFESDGLFSDTVIIAAGDVKIDLGTRVLVIAKGQVTIKSPVQCTIRAKSKQVFGEVGFFNPGLVGIDVEAGEKNVRIEKLRDGCAFTKAGLRVGDTVLTVGDTKVESVNQFTQLLRGAMLSNQAEFLIRRDEAQVRVKVRFGE